MPSPNSQNLRSAPQKQPRPNIAFSEPAGYGPFNARPLTKCVSAVRIACERPGNASAAVGMAVFLKPNMGDLPVSGRYIGSPAHGGTRDTITIAAGTRLTGSRDCDA